MHATASRLKNRDTYEILTLFLGFFGLNRLYFGDYATPITRFFLFSSAASLLGTAITLLSGVVAFVGAVFLALMTFLWIADYLTMARQLAKYEARGLG